ncbi:hypothetical protein OH492_14355 [Vibrio chagasii]|nr:hypothetical protein [Vibrio chagasii]
MVGKQAFDKGAIQVRVAASGAAIQQVNRFFHTKHLRLTTVPAEHPLGSLWTQGNEFDCWSTSF